MPSSSHWVWPWLRLAAIGLGFLGQADQLEHLVDTLLAFAGEAESQIGEHPRIAAARDLEIAADGQILEHARNLELAPDAGARDFVLFPVGDFGVVEKHAAAGALGLARDQIHQRRLAGAVGAEKHAQLALIDDHRDRVDGLEAVEVD